MVWDYLNTYGFLGNTFMQYIYFIITIVISFAIAKFAFKFCKGALRKATEKTKTKLDDIIIDTIEEPAILAIVIIGIRIAVGILTLPENLSSISKDIISVVLFVDIIWLCSRTATALIENFVKPAVIKTNKQMGEHFTYLLKRTTKIIIWGLGIVFIISNLGYNISTLIAGLGIGGVAIALALKDILGNMFGGFTVITDMPFKVGDRIKIEGIDGFVKEIGVRSTKIRSFDGTEYILPNSKVVDSVIENVSREKARRVKMNLGVEYSTPNKKIDEAKKMIKDIVKKNKSTDDECMVYFTEFGDSALILTIIYYIKDLDNIFPARDEINMEIKKGFEKAKISIAFPTMTLHLKED